MTKDEALKLALDALEAHADIGIKSDKAITAIKQARALDKMAENERELGIQMQPAQDDPCPGCRKGAVCRTPKCGRLKLPVDHPYRSKQPAQHEHAEKLAKLGWQYFECPACGSEGARAFPKPAQRKPLTDEQEREGFEAHWYSFYHSGSVSARSDGSYVHPHVQRAWEAWQARAAQE